MAARERDRRKRAHRRSEVRETRRERQSKRKRIRRYILGTVTGIGALMIILSLVLPGSLGNMNSSATTSYAEGSRIDIQSPILVDENETHPEYNSSPPTSGWYQDIPEESIMWGETTEELKPEKQVAYLRKGAVLVQYNCLDLETTGTFDECTELRDNLRIIVNRYPEGVVQAHNENIETLIALSSWGWLDTLDEYDELRIEDFIQMRLDKGPASFKQQ